MNIPDHVLATFQLDNDAPVPVGAAWDNGLRFGRIVVSRANPTAAWSAKLRYRLSIDGLLVARPVRSTDGRFVVSGFKANEFAEGAVTSRVDEVMAAAMAFDRAMVGVATPALERTDRWAEAENIAWRDVEHASFPGPWQVGHADFFHSCVFAGSLPPLMTDIVPTSQPRPVGYTAALAMVDGLLSRSVDEAVVQRWAHISALPELALRALDYREALAPAGDSNMHSEVSRVRTLLVSA
ncbi:hypothetical protein [Corynebacterium sp. LK2510]|uniref:hypothetical protein n=1 Tax=Corynebacterium sp. LK2510 TaxID=3110472 RepID=UPI0034D004B5